MKHFDKFKREFPRRGLLFWGLWLFALGMALGGILTKEYFPRQLLLGALCGLLLGLGYHALMALGRKISRILAIAALCALLPCLPIFIAKHTALVLILPASLPEWLFGKGITSFALPQINAFLAILNAFGLFGTLAFLIHLKHLLELIIRRFSLKKSIPLIPPVVLLALPSFGGIWAAIALTAYLFCLCSAEHELEEIRRRRLADTKPITRRKPRVLFPFIEAGKGHVTPERAVCDIFKQKYGDRFEVVESKFYSETENSALIRTEELFASAVRSQNKHRILSLLCRLGNFLAGDRFAQFVLLTSSTNGKRSRKHATQHLRELDADIIFCTHWSVPYYVSRMKDSRPYTIMFCPDVFSNGMFNIDCNEFLMPMEHGLRKVKKIRMYAGGNCKKVKFPIRNEAREFVGRRDELRQKMGIAEDAFVVTLCDGGYGMAKLESTVEQLLKSDTSLTIIALCGTNSNLAERLSKLTVPEHITLKPFGFTDKVLELLAVSDIFVGKSGANSMAEPAFFGVPIIITKYITYIERHIKDFYVRELGGAMYTPSPKRAAKMVIDFAKHPEKLDKYKAAMAEFSADCSAEDMADVICEAMRGRGQGNLLERRLPPNPLQEL